MAVYLDYNATTPVSETVQEVITKTLKETWGNPSSIYDIGKTAKFVVEDARRKVSEMISADPREIVFTSGGTESNNMVIHTAIKHFKLNKERGPVCKPHIVTSTIEHDSVRLVLQNLDSEGEIDVTCIPVNPKSYVVEIDDIVGAVRPNTCLISLMLANNETGVIQPSVRLLRKELKAMGINYVLLHTDAAQAIGKIEVDVKSLGVDYLTIVGHKFYGPRVGALYVKQGSPLYPMFYGGGQERNLRPGTENVAMIAGLGAAASDISAHLSSYSKTMHDSKVYLSQHLRKLVSPSVIFNIPEYVSCLPNTLSVAFDIEGATGWDILEEASQVYASTGSACHGGKQTSSVLVASGVSSHLASKTLRLSVGRETSLEDVDCAMKHLKSALKKLGTKFL